MLTKPEMAGYRNLYYWSEKHLWKDPARLAMRQWSSKNPKCWYLRKAASPGLEETLSPTGSVSQTSGKYHISSWEGTLGVSHWVSISTLNFSYGKENHSLVHHPNCHFINEGIQSFGDLLWIWSNYQLLQVQLLRAAVILQSVLITPPSFQVADYLVSPEQES